MSQLESLLQLCTVKLTIPGKGGWGTGFFVAPELILTCAHVVHDVQEKPLLIRWQSQEGWAQAVVEVIQPEPYDLALLRVTLPASVQPPCVYLDGEIQSRDPLYLFGYPDQDFPNGCPATVNCEGLTGDKPPLIKFALGQVRPGMSGSPLLNQRTGKVCGMVKFTRDRTIDLGGGAISTSVILNRFPSLHELQQQFHLKDTFWLQQIEILKVSIPENLPRSGVINFVGRTGYITDLHTIIQQSFQSTLSAIVGMGGVGKTELALQYAMNYKADYSAGICWLSARGGDIGSQIIQFGKSLLDINPPESLDPLDQVRFCWRNWPLGSVLLIFDDVTDYSSVKKYFPPITETRFKILITSRLILGASVKQINLDVLQQTEALELLNSFIDNERTRQEFKSSQLICEQLGYLPLAIELVGRHLSRKPDVSLESMLNRLRSKRLSARALCKTEDDMTARLGVAAAFELSWENLPNEARALAFLVSQFALEPILWDLICQCLNDQDPEDLEPLRDESLVDSNLLQYRGNNAYQMHGLVRDFILQSYANLDKKRELEKRFCELMLNVAASIPRVPTRSLIFELSSVIPHIKEMSFRLKTHLNNDQYSIPFIGLANYYSGQGWYQQANEFHHTYLAEIETRFGTQHLEYAQALSCLAESSRELGQYTEAESLVQQALSIRRNLLQGEHLAIAQNLDDLAVLYAYKQRYEEAELLCNEALRIRQKELRPTDPSLIESLNNLASIYNGLARYEDAETIFLEVLEIREREYPTDHPNIIVSLNNLSECYYLKGSFQKAEELYFQALERTKAIFGEDHPNMAISLNNLASLYFELEKYESALPLFEQGLQLSRKFLGDIHPDIALTLSNLASCYDSLGMSEDAESMYLQALEMRQVLFGEDHPKAAITMNNLAKLYSLKKQYSKAESLYRKAIEIFENNFGHEHP